MYASTRETRARFRLDFALLAELKEIEGDDDFVPLGEVSSEWCDGRLIATASAAGTYADIYASGWIAFLRTNLVGECLCLGVKDIYATVLQNYSTRRITQLASLRIYERGFSGIYYCSRHGHDFENWRFDLH